MRPERTTIWHRVEAAFFRGARPSVLLFFVVALAGRSPVRAEVLPSEVPSCQDQFWSQVKDMKAGPVTFDLGGQVRFRYEYDDGFTIKGYEPDGHDQLLLERVRLDFSARFWERPRLFLQLQDAHPFLTRFGEEDFPKSSPIEDTLDIRQLYAEWKKIGDSPFGFRIGRQQIAYGDQRVFGPGNWGNTGRFAWDAAMFILDTDWLATDLWVGKYLLYRTDVWPNRSIEGFWTLVGYVQVKRLPFRLDLFYALKVDESGNYEGESGAGGLWSHTIGIQAEGRAVEVVDMACTLIGQFGRYGQDALRAFGANLKLGATAPGALKPRLGVQYTWGSGDANPHDGVHQTFDGVFGGRDIFFYGYLNLFFWANLRDLEIDVSATPWHGLTLHAEYHHFDLDQAEDAWYTTGLKVYRRDPAGVSGTALGDEFDLRAVLNLWNHLELMAGYGRFFPGGFVKSTGPSAPANWFFAQAAYSW